MFKELLVPLDGSLLAECVLPHTIAFARAFDARVTLLHVMPTSHLNALHSGAPQYGMPTDVTDWRMLQMEANAYLDRIAAHLATAGVAVETLVSQGDPAHNITNTIENNGIDLVILSSHGESGLTGWNIGSVVQKVLLHIPISSLLVRAYQPVETRQTDLKYRRLLVPLDGSLRAECVLPFATRLTKFHNAQLLLTHIVSCPEAPRQKPLSEKDNALVQQLVTRNHRAAATHFEQLIAHLPVEAHLNIQERQDATTALHEVAEDAEADLMIMSAHGYSGRKRWPYGRVTSNFIVYGTAPLLLVQDLVASERPPSAAEQAAHETGGHRYMAKERYLERVR